VTFVWDPILWDFIEGSSFEAWICKVGICICFSLCLGSLPTWHLAKLSRNHLGASPDTQVT
jgi:hypothetical protein